MVKPVNYNYLVDGSRYNFQLLSYYMRGHLSGIDELINIWNKINKVRIIEISNVLIQFGLGFLLLK